MNLAAWADEGAPVWGGRVGEFLMEEHDFDASAAWPSGKEPGRNDSGIVHDKYIAWAKIFTDIVKVTVGNGVRRVSWEHEQAGIVPLFGGMGGNQALWEVKGKVFYIHGLWRRCGMVLYFGNLLRSLQFAIGLKKEQYSEKKFDFSFIKLRNILDARPQIVH